MNYRVMPEFLYKPVKMSQLYDALVAIFSTKPFYVTPQPAAVVSLDGQMGVRHPLRILLAEDHDVNQKVAVMLLERLGYRADVAANGLEALEALRRQEYDLVLMDIHMPEMDGVEATRHIRNRLPPELQPYIVALTANALEGDRETYLKAGMDDYLSKPLRVEQLVQVLGRCPSRLPAVAPLSVPSATTGQDMQTAVPSLEEKPADLAVNLATLGEYFPGWQNEPAVLAELSQMFFEDTEKRLPQITSWLETREGESARKGAHTIKGASLTFGAETLAALCKQLEDDLRAGNWPQAEEHLEKVMQEYWRVKQSLLKLIGIDEKGG
jgi:CheY-like chemotaxis protein